jgi:vacuolar-type H+-ATPase subunit E/Vma4
MSEQVTITPEQQIVAAIRADAESQARAIIEKANDAAKLETDEATRAAGAAEARVLALAGRDAARITAKALASAHVDARRILLQAREKAIETALALVAAELERIRTNPTQYRQALQRLLFEAVLGLNGERVVVTMGATDKDMVDPVMLEEIRKLVREACGRNVVIELRFDARDLGGGCVATTQADRIRLDNTFSRRLQESKKQLKSMVIAELTRP